MEGFDLSSLDVTLVVGWASRVVFALLVFIGGMMAAKMVRRGVRRALERSELDNTLVPFLSGMVYYVSVVIVVVAVLGMFGIQTASFVAILGAAGLAVGLSLQGTLSNFAAGVMLLIFRPFGVGDFIDAGGTTGTVEAIGIFATTLKSPDNILIVASNSQVYGSVIKNYSAFDTRRNDIVIGVSYDDDLNKAMTTIRAILDADPRVLKDPEPLVAVSELGDSSVNFVVRPWCTREDYWALRFDLLKTLKEQLESAGCSIPFPQTDVHLHQTSGAA